MAREILAVPEDRLREVIAVIRAGLACTCVTRETMRGLSEWCDAEEAYLDQSSTAHAPEQS